jgi:hypothetical protein
MKYHGGAHRFLVRVSHVKGHLLQGINHGDGHLLQGISQEDNLICVIILTTPKQAHPEERSRVTISALQWGKVLNLDLVQGYGFLAPIGTVASSNNVYFRFGGTSNVETGMLQLEVGDIFEFVSNESPDRPREIYACLVQCNPRSSEALASYLDTLLSQSQASTGSNVLREITKCPAGFLQVLNFQKPPFDLVYSVLELVNIISHGIRGRIIYCKVEAVL